MGTGVRSEHSGPWEGRVQVTPPTKDRPATAELPAAPSLGRKGLRRGPGRGGARGTAGEHSATTGRSVQGTDALLCTGAWRATLREKLHTEVVPSTPTGYDVPADRHGHGARGVHPALRWAGELGTGVQPRAYLLRLLCPPRTHALPSRHVSEPNTLARRTAAPLKGAASQTALRLDVATRPDSGP